MREVHLLLLLTLSLNFEGSVNLEAVVPCWTCLHGLKVLIFKATKKSSERDKISYCLYGFRRYR